MKRLFLSLTACAFLASSAAADIVFVNATAGAGGNTTLADGSTFSPPLNGTTGNDNNWEERTTFGASGNIFESAGEGAGQDENAPELRTTISGLTPLTTYSIYAYFWDPTSGVEDWNMRAGFSSNPGANQLFTRDDALLDFPGFSAPLAASLASNQIFTTAPSLFNEGGRDLLAASLGEFTADANGQIQVFIDDLNDGATGAGNVNRRTWYDGVGYAAIPEPTSASLLAGLFVGMFARRRR